MAETDREPIISVEGLTMAFGDFVVQKDLTFTVRRGDNSHRPEPAGWLRSSARFEGYGPPGTRQQNDGRNRAHRVESWQCLFHDALPSNSCSSSSGLEIKRAAPWATSSSAER